MGRNDLCLQVRSELVITERTECTKARSALGSHRTACGLLEKCVVVTDILAAAPVSVAHRQRHSNKTD